MMLYNPHEGGDYSKRDIIATRYGQQAGCSYHCTCMYRYITTLRNNTITCTEGGSVGRNISAQNGYLCMLRTRTITRIVGGIV